MIYLDSTVSNVAVDADGRLVAVASGHQLRITRSVRDYFVRFDGWLEAKLAGAGAVRG